MSKSFLVKGCGRNDHCFMLYYTFAPTKNRNVFFQVFFLPHFFGVQCFVCLFLNVLVNNQAISRTAPKTERLTIFCAATHETELGYHDFCLSRSHYADTDPTSREWAATAGIEPGTSSPGVARSTDSATASKVSKKNLKENRLAGLFTLPAFHLL